jgi:hypothetical protein
MNANRQDMANVELTVEEVRYAIECAILSKYPFLDERQGWDLQDAEFHDKNLNDYRSATANVAGATFFYVKNIKVDDAPPADKGCGNCLKPCR